MASDELADALADHASEGAELRAEVRDEAVDTLQMMDDFKSVRAARADVENVNFRVGRVAAEFGDLPVKVGDTISFNQTQPPYQEIQDIVSTEFMEPWYRVRINGKRTSIGLPESDVLKLIERGDMVPDQSKQALIRISPPDTVEPSWFLRREFEYEAGDVVMSPEGLGEVVDQYDDGRTVLVRLEPSGALFPCQMNRLWKVVEATGKKVSCRAHEVKAVSPPGLEDLVKKLKEQGVANPWATAWKVYDEKQKKKKTSNYDDVPVGTRPAALREPKCPYCGNNDIDKLSIDSDSSTAHCLVCDKTHKTAAGKGPYPGGIMPPKWVPWSLREIWRAAVERYQDEGGDLDDPNVYAGVVSWYKRLMEKYAPESPISMPHDYSSQKKPWEKEPSADTQEGLQDIKKMQTGSVHAELDHEDLFEDDVSSSDYAAVDLGISGEDISRGVK